MKRFILRFLPIWGLMAAAQADPPPVVAIQPLGPVRPADIRKVKEGIAGLYAVTVEVLPEKPLPKIAYYKPRNRYKADDIVEVTGIQEPARAHKIIALTTRDISTTTDESEDWGIMGLGQIGGRACVVSTFRLRAGKAGDALFSARLVKVVNHELGHTFGLGHCPTAGCLMQDAKGKIATMDGENGKPCADCSARLPLLK
ncbi:MAG: archaemetzincin [Verrucomicrobiota bacterium]